MLRKGSLRRQPLFRGEDLDNEVNHLKLENGSIGCDVTKDGTQGETVNKECT